MHKISKFIWTGDSVINCNKTACNAKPIKFAKSILGSQNIQLILAVWESWAYILYPSLLYLVCIPFTKDYTKWVKVGFCMLLLKKTKC